MPKIISTHCLICQSNTNQKILFVKKEELPESNEEYNAAIFKDETLYMTIRCAGCDSISFLKRISIIDISTPTDEPTIIDENYPEEENDFNFLNDEELKALPKTLRKLYIEVVNAFQNESEILAGLGLRTLVEGVCIELKISGANLQTKIISLKNEGWIANNELPIIDKLRIIGNFAAHEIKGLPFDILSYALDIINHVLKSIYILPKINKKIKI